MLNKEIGGYFELELPKVGQHYHPNALKLNSARNSFEYILKVLKPKKVYLPYFNCAVMLEPIKKTDICHEFYHIDKNLEIVNKISLQQDEYILYINYFGIKNKYVKTLIKKYGKYVIIDNSQSFFTILPNKVLSIYSPRKFFGVPDGGYLAGELSSNLLLKHDKSIGRISHLIGRIEETGNQYYSEFKKNDDSLSMQNIKRMSKITDILLGGLDYQDLLKIRNDNFLFLHEKLKNINELHIELKHINGPLIYPLLLKNDIKNILIQNKIYIATYWQEVLNIPKISHIEQYLTSHLLALPIDQRYNKNDMRRIVKIIKEIL